MRGESFKLFPALSSPPGSSREEGSGREILGSDPARYREPRRGGVRRLEAWLEEEEAGLYLLVERAGLHRASSFSFMSESFRIRIDSFPTASSSPKIYVSLVSRFQRNKECPELREFINSSSKKGGRDKLISPCRRTEPTKSIQQLNGSCFGAI